MSKDQIIFDLIKEEKTRQIEGIELIASENFTSDNVMKATGSENFDFYGLNRQKKYYHLHYYINNVQYSFLGL